MLTLIRNAGGVYDLKNVVYGNYLIKKPKHLPVRGDVSVYSVWLRVINDSRDPLECTGGRVDSCKESSLLPIGRPGVIYDSLPHGYILFYGHLD